MKKLKIPRVIVITDKPKPELIERNTVWIQIKPNDNIKSLISTGMRMAPDIMVIDTVDTNILNMAGSMNPDIDIYTYEDYYSRDHILDSKYVDSASDIGQYRDITYGIEDSGEQRYYFQYEPGKFCYGDTEEEIQARIDQWLDEHIVE